MVILIRIAFLLLISPLFLFSGQITGRVISVIDGDTIRILTPDKQNIKIRLNCIDAPEKRMPYGKKSKYHLSDLIFGKEVTVITHGRGHYGRIIGTIILNGRDINLEQVKAGMAWVYRKYCHAPKYYEAEKYAREHKLGLWQDPNPIPPWEWRHHKKYGTYYHHKTQSKFHCGSKKYCSQMSSCEEAYFYLRECGLKRLDRDGDGVPCERLCR